MTRVVLDRRRGGWRRGLAVARATRVVVVGWRWSRARGVWRGEQRFEGSRRVGLGLAASPAVASNFEF